MPYTVKNRPWRTATAVLTYGVVQVGTDCTVAACLTEDLAQALANILNCGLEWEPLPTPVAPTPAAEPDPILRFEDLKPGMYVQSNDGRMVYRVERIDEATAAHDSFVVVALVWTTEGMPANPVRRPWGRVTVRHRCLYAAHPEIVKTIEEANRATH